MTGETGDFNRMVYGEDLWKSKPIDFDTDGRKHLTGISVDAEKDVIVNIKGEFGSKNITLKVNSGKRRLNLVSDSFAFTVSGIETKSAPPIHSIRLYYRENDKT